MLTRVCTLPCSFKMVNMCACVCVWHVCRVCACVCMRVHVCACVVCTYYCGNEVALGSSWMMPERGQVQLKGWSMTWKRPGTENYPI